MIVQLITANINIFICFKYSTRKKRAIILLLMIRSHVETCFANGVALPPIIMNQNEFCLIQSISGRSVA